MTRREWTKRAILLAIELDKHIVPYLNHIWVIHVDETRCVAVTDTVVVDFTAWTTRARRAHFPEVVLCIARKDMVISHADLAPNFERFHVRLQTLRGVTFKVCHIQTILRKAIHLREKFPRISNSFLLKVVAKAPVTKHLEESMMIRVLTNIVQIIVLTSSTNALLGVDSTTQLGKVGRRIHCAEENGLVLIHTSIGE